jgi:hypothetical protein
MAENIKKDTGIVHSKPTNEWTDPKTGEKKIFQSLVIEIKLSKNFKDKDGKERFVTKNNLMKFDTYGIDIDPFDIEDLIDVSYFIEGKEYLRKDTGMPDVINKLKATYIKHADLDRGHSNHKGKVKVDSTTNPSELKQDDIFVGATPDDDEWDKNLPF